MDTRGWLELVGILALLWSLSANLLVKRKLNKALLSSDQAVKSLSTLSHSIQTLNNHISAMRSSVTQALQERTNHSTKS